MVPVAATEEMAEFSQSNKLHDLQRQTSNRRLAPHPLVVTREEQLLVNLITELFSPVQHQVHPL